MKFMATKIPDVVVIEPKIYGDERGFFMETWQADVFARAGIPAAFVQDNHSSSGRGVLRGLHYQLTRPQGKLVRVIKGRVFDVAVDLRQGSPTFGKWVAEVLSAENHLILWIPPGFAHGFYVLSDCAEFVYKCTDFYFPRDERCIRWDDPDLAIDWQLLDTAPPLLSDKDKEGCLLRDAEVYPVDSADDNRGVGRI